MSKYKCICRSKESNKKRFDKKFVQLPKYLYTKKDIVTDADVEKQILSGRHILSADFQTESYLVIDTENGKTVARAVLSYYQEDPKAYLGFFEAINSQEAVNLLFDEVCKKCKMDKKSEIVGPIDVSFWLGYRFKVKSDSEFCLRFTGEPYNRDYYPELWQNYGFEVSDIYFSNRIRRINPADVDKKCVKRFEQSIEKGYEYRNLDMKQFDRQLDEVYELFIELYSSFPGFTHISKEQFHGLFKNMKLIIRPEMAKFVYKDGKLVGFFICIPNFYNLTTQISLVNILKILRIKKKPKEYVLLYMGVKPEALGLGAALAEVVRRQLEIMGVESIGALIHQGKVTGNYYKKCIIDKYEYVLLKKQV